MSLGDRLQEIVYYVVTLTAMLDEYDEYLYHLNQVKLKLKLLEVFHASYDDEVKEKIMSERDSSSKAFDALLVRLKEFTGGMLPEEARIHASNIKRYLHEILERANEEFVVSLGTDASAEEMAERLLEHTRRTP